MISCRVVWVRIDGIREPFDHLPRVLLKRALSPMMINAAQQAFECVWRNRRAVRHELARCPERRYYFSLIIIAAQSGLSHRLIPSRGPASPCSLAGAAARAHCDVAARRRDGADFLDAAEALTTGKLLCRFHNETKPHRSTARPSFSTRQAGAASATAARSARAGSHRKARHARGQGPAQAQWRA